jgi:photosystem II stability/assembly factor-like uncharacterized protein
MMRLCAALLFITLLGGSRFASAQTLPENSLKPLKWHLVGPARGGRVLTVSGVVGQPNTFYFGAVAGGVFKTTDAGANWTPIFDKQANIAVGAIAVAPSDPNVIYVGSGEACIRGDITYGNGVHKSTDAGKTWKHLGLEDTRQIGRIAVDPHNPDVVFVAALGHAFGPNTERGLFRSSDGGKTWQKVLYRDDKTGAIDVSIDPSNSRILYAALWQAVRSPWGMESGGPGSGIYKSADGGLTWAHLEGHGLPKGTLGRVGIAAAAGGTDRVYALIEAEQGGFYRSDDGGENWILLTDNRDYRQRPWYFTHVYADPQDPNGVYILELSAYHSRDGGKSFTMDGGCGDCHGLWIDPNDPHRRIESGDGGAEVTVNDGKTWTNTDAEPISQFYHVATDNQFNYRIYGAQQDSGTVAIASHPEGGPERDYYDVSGGESGWVVPDPPGDFVYADSYDGDLTRWEKKSGGAVSISAWPLNPMGGGAADLKHRFQWTAPIALSPFDSNTVYFGGEVLYKSTNQGKTWSIISPDLTRNDKSKQQSSGGPLTKDNTSVEYYDDIFNIVESPLARGTIWIGTDDGLIQLTRDGGQTWNNVTPKGIPDWSTVSLIEASSRDAGTAYAAVDRHRLDDLHPYLFKTTDFGKNWSRINNGIPDGAYTHVVREDPVRRGMLYAGTEMGIYVSFDDGSHWQSMQFNLPTSPVHDLVIHGDDLIVATHGRSFWSLDNISTLRQWNDQVPQEDVHVFTPIVAYHEQGATLEYWLKAAPKDPIRIEISDGQGKVLRKVQSTAADPSKAGEEQKDTNIGFGDKVPAAAGLNRYTWDEMTEAPAKIPGHVGWGGGFTGVPVPSGTYHAKFTVAGKDYSTAFEIKIDPRINVTADDLQKQFELGMRIKDRVNEGAEAVNNIRGLRDQLAQLQKRLGGDDKYKDINKDATDLTKKITDIENTIIQTKSKSSEDPLNFPILTLERMMVLQGSVGGGSRGPAPQDYEVFDVINKDLEAELAKWKEARDKDLAALNAKISQANVPVLGFAVKKAE